MKFLFTLENKGADKCEEIVELDNKAAVAAYLSEVVAELEPGGRVTLSYAETMEEITHVIKTR